MRASLKNAQELYSQWCMQLESQQDLEKLQAATTDLRSCIKSIEWDLQDLDETISKSKLVLILISVLLFYFCS